MDRLRAALGWFSRISVDRQRSILKRALKGAAVAFVIGVIAITAVEYGIGNSLACGIWSNCSVTSAPGYGGGNAYTASGARSGYSILAGRSLGGGVSQAPSYGQQGGGLFGGGAQQAPAPQQGGGFFGGGGQQAPQQSGGGFFGGGQQSAQPAEPVQPEAPVVPQQDSGVAP